MTGLRDEDYLRIGQNLRETLRREDYPGLMTILDASVLEEICHEFGIKAEGEPAMALASEWHLNPLSRAYSDLRRPVFGKDQVRYAAQLEKRIIDELALAIGEERTQIGRSYIEDLFSEQYRRDNGIEGIRYLVAMAYSPLSLVNLAAALLSSWKSMRHNAASYITTQLQELGSKVDSLTKALTAYEQENGELKSRVKILKTERKTGREDATELRTLRSTVEEQLKRISDLETELGQLRDAQYHGAVALIVDQLGLDASGIDQAALAELCMKHEGIITENGTLRRLLGLEQQYSAMLSRAPEELMDAMKAIIGDAYSKARIAIVGLNPETERYWTGMLRDLTGSKEIIFSRNGLNGSTHDICIIGRQGDVTYQHPHNASVPCLADGDHHLVLPLNGKSNLSALATVAYNLLSHAGRFQPYD